MVTPPRCTSLLCTFLGFSTVSIKSDSLHESNEGRRPWRRADSGRGWTGHGAGRQEICWKFQEYHLRVFHCCRDEDTGCMLTIRMHFSNLCILFASGSMYIPCLCMHICKWYMHIILCMDVFKRMFVCMYEFKHVKHFFRSCVCVRYISQQNKTCGKNDCWQEISKQVVAGTNYFFKIKTLVAGA